MPIFRVKSVKIYTGQKKFTRVYPWLPWQIWGMIRNAIETNTTVKSLKSKDDWVTDSVTRSPIELSWTAKNLTQSALQKIAPGECDQLCEQQGWQCWLCQWTPHHTSEKLRLVNIKRQTFDEYFTFAICVLFYDEHLTFAIDVFIFSLSVPSNPSLWGSWW